MKLTLRKTIAIMATSLMLTACGSSEVTFEKKAFNNNKAEFFVDKDITRTIYSVNSNDTDKTVKLLTKHFDDAKATERKLGHINVRDIKEIKAFDMPLSFDIPEAKNPVN
jgi:major membrane immunogen (membrane-anchored lipoprotein)